MLQAKTAAVESLSNSLSNFKWSVLVWLRVLRVVAFKMPKQCLEMQSQVLQASPPDATLFRGANKVRGEAARVQALGPVEACNP